MSEKWQCLIIGLAGIGIGIGRGYCIYLSATNPDIMVVAYLGLYGVCPISILFALLPFLPDRVWNPIRWAFKIKTE